MNKRQRKKQQKKQASEFNGIGITLEEAADAVTDFMKNLVNTFGGFLDRSAQERPEEIRQQLLAKVENGDRLLRWEQLLLDKVEAELERREKA